MVLSFPDFPEGGSMLHRDVDAVNWRDDHARLEVGTRSSAG
jgi:hypothetical protein